EALDGLSEPPFQLVAALARNLFRQRRFAEALSHFDALAQKFGIADPALNGAYAACLAAEGRATEAEVMFRHALASAPDAHAIARDYAAFLIRGGRYDEAARLLEPMAANSAGGFFAESTLLICRMSFSV